MDFVCFLRVCVYPGSVSGGEGGVVGWGGVASIYESPGNHSRVQCLACSGGGVGALQGIVFRMEEKQQQLLQHGLA